MRGLLVVVVLLAACKKDDPGPPLKPALVPVAPRVTKDQDALWALATPGATIAVVVSPRGVGELDAGFTTFVELFKKSPELASANKDLQSWMTEELGTATPSLAKLGMTHDRGFAVFISDGGIAAILPVTDRDAWLAATHGERHKDLDEVAGYTCKPINDVYACASPAALLDHIGKGDLKAKIALAGARGDVEVSVELNAMHFAGVMQLDHGAMVVRGGITGLPGIITEHLRETAKPRVDPTTTAFAVVSKSLLVDLPDFPIVAGVSLGELGRSFAGPLTIASPAGVVSLDMHVALSDEGPAKKLVEHCKELPGLGDTPTKVDDGVCEIDMYPLGVNAKVANKEFRITPRNKRAGRKSPLSPVATELATGEWALAMYGRGAFADVGLVAQGMTAEDEDERIGLRLMTLINEVGLGVRMEGDTVRVLALVRTAYSNPTEVIAKLVATPTMELLRDREVAKAIAKLAPSAPFADDHGASWGGLVIPGLVIAGIAVVLGPTLAPFFGD